MSRWNDALRRGLGQILDAMRQTRTVIDYATASSKRPHRPLPTLLVAHVVASYATLAGGVLLGFAIMGFKEASVATIALIIFAPIVMPYLLVGGLLAYLYRQTNMSLWMLALWWAAYLVSVSVCYRLYPLWRSRMK